EKEGGRRTRPPTGQAADDLPRRATSPRSEERTARLRARPPAESRRADAGVSCLRLTGQHQDRGKKEKKRSKQIGAGRSSYRGREGLLSGLPRPGIGIPSADREQLLV